MRRGFAAGLALVLCGCAAARLPDPSQAPPSPPQAGYLSRDARLDAARFLPGPPESETPAAAADRAAVEATAALANTPRWRVAQADAELDPEMAPQMFDCAVGARLAEGRPPALTRLFRGVVQDAQAAWAPAKNRWSRPRPTREPFCLRERVENGAYPDGHAALGMAWALILSELAPDRADLVMARGLAVGDSRVVCGMNHPTDVEAGRVVGAALYAALQAEPRFRADMALARAEVAAARAKGTTNPVCTAERGALAPQAGRGS